jgi:hypothetical protein
MLRYKFQNNAVIVEKMSELGGLLEKLIVAGFTIEKNGQINAPSSIFSFFSEPKPAVQEGMPIIFTVKKDGNTYTIKSETFGTPTIEIPSEIETALNKVVADDFAKWKLGMTPIGGYRRRRRSSKNRRSRRHKKQNKKQKSRSRR